MNIKPDRATRANDVESQVVLCGSLALSFTGLKHSRQRTGFPLTGINGTVDSLPHWAPFRRVSGRTFLRAGYLRFALHRGQRRGSLTKPFSLKYVCSPAVNKNSAPHSMQVRSLSENAKVGLRSIWRMGQILRHADASGNRRKKAHFIGE